jgi:hypothetical protein
MLYLFSTSINHWVSASWQLSGCLWLRDAQGKLSMRVHACNLCTWRLRPAWDTQWDPFANTHTHIPQKKQIKQCRGWLLEVYLAAHENDRWVRGNVGRKTLNTRCGKWIKRIGVFNIWHERDQHFKTCLLQVFNKYFPWTIIINCTLFFEL